jgi:hypothetical protein
MRSWIVSYFTLNQLLRCPLELWTHPGPMLWFIEYFCKKMGEIAEISNGPRVFLTIFWWNDAFSDKKINDNWTTCGLHRKKIFKSWYIINFPELILWSSNLSEKFRTNFSDKFFRTNFFGQIFGHIFPLNCPTKRFRKIDSRRYCYKWNWH